MPRKTKTTKRTSSAKKRGLFDKVNFSSRKTQFITVILLVAVLGGGWFTYRSFAATGAYVARCSDFNTTCKNVNDSQSSKNNGNVVETTGGTVNGSGSLTVNPGQKFRACASIKPLAYSRIQISTSINVPNGVQTSYWGKNDSYKEHCTLWVTWNSVHGQQITPTPQLIVSEGKVRVAYVVIQTQDSSNSKK